MNTGWRAPRRMEQQYYYDLVELLRRYFDYEQTGISQAHLLNRLEFLESYAWQAAQRMVTGLYVSNSRSWRAAARESMQGPRLYRALQSELRGSLGGRVRALINHNAALIRSLPDAVRGRIAQTVSERAYAGERVESVEGMISHVSRVQARLIARTEISKATTALTQARAEDLGLDWYVWETSQDQRVRRSHRRMQGVLVSWSEPPSPERLFGERQYGSYAAGNIFNCRCYPAPLLRLNQINWPHKVHLGGRVQTMSLAAFRRAIHPELEAA